MPSFLFFHLGVFLTNTREEVVHVGSSSQHSGRCLLQSSGKGRTDGCLGLSINKVKSYELDVQEKRQVTESAVSSPLSP